MRKLLTAAGLLALCLFWSCHLGPEDSEDRFDLIGDSAWTDCDNVQVVLLDGKGNVADTIFNEALKDVAQLKNLSAAGYDGSSATLHISGTKDGGACFDESRTFEGDGKSLKIDTVKSLTAEPKSVRVEPDSVSIALDAAAIPVKASILPAFADQSVTWNLSADGIVSLANPSGGAGGQVKIKPEKIGATTITVRSVKDPSKTALLKITVTAPLGIKVNLSKENLALYLGGPGETLTASVEPSSVNQKVAWSTMNPNVATVDSSGNVKSAGEGETYVIAKSISTEASGSALVVVKRDAPVLVIASKTGAPVNSRITFSPRSTQAFGTIIMYKWDLGGDGDWDDSSSVPGIGEVVDLQPQSTSYPKEGTYKARFLVRDSEGNETTAEVSVDIGNQAPEISAIRADASISIKDSLDMTASVRDVDGKVVWCGWDYDGNGTYDDSIVAADSSVEVVLGHRYPDAGLQLAIFKAIDETGKTRLDTVKIKVELDRPVADAGEDTTVTVGSPVNLHLDGTDKYGKIEKREVRLHGSGLGFLELSKPDTTITAPAEPGTYLVVLKVTDDDGLVDVDSVNVTVVLSANAELTSLAFSAGPLDPAFKPTIQFFSARAAFGDSSVTVTPTAKDKSSTISVNAKSVASGAASDPVKLAVGSNNKVFEIVVTSADGTQRVYYLSVARDPSADATLSKLDVTGFALKPVFAPTKVEYADTVSSATASVTFKPTLAASTAALAFNDSAMASGTATFPQPLAIGENVFKITVTSQSGTAKTTYQIKVIRKAKLELYKRQDGKVTLTDSSEVVPGAAHSILSAPVTGYHFLKWTVTEGTAILSDSAANPAGLTLKSALVRAQAELAVNKYDITAGANAGGSISPSGLVPVDHGQNKAFTISVNKGFTLKSVTVDGSNATGALVNGVYTFANVIAPHGISAAFVKLDTIATKVGLGGGILPVASPIIVEDGSDTTFTIEPKEGFKIATFLVDGADAKDKLVGNKFTFKAITGNHTLEVTFIEGFTLTGVDDAGATVTPHSVGVNKGDSQVFTLAPKSSDYRIAGLLDNGVDVFSMVVNNTYTLKDIAASHIVAVISKRFYTITVVVTGNGTGKVDPTAVVEAGASKNFKYEAAQGSRLTTFKVDGVEEKPTGSYTFSTVAANHSIELNFVKIHAISTIWSAGGVNNAGGAISPANPTLDAGESPIFTITPTLVAPNSGYRLDSTVVDGIKDASPRTSIQFANLASGHSIVAGFKRYFYIENGAGTGGSIAPANAKVDTLGTQVISYSAAAGYRFLRLLDNGVPVAGATVPSYTLGAATGGIKSDHVMKAEFIRQYTVTETHTGIGKINIPQPLVDADSSQVITIEPKTGYKLTQVKDNGVIIAIQDPYKGTSFPINKIAGNHALEVTFTAYYTLTATVTSTKFGSVSPANQVVDSGSTASFTISPLANWVVKGVLDKTSGGTKEIPAIISFQLNVHEPHDFTVDFSEGATMPVAMSAVSSSKGTLSANLCVLIGKERNCGASPHLVNVPAGTILNLFGEDGMLTNDIGFREDASVEAWGQVIRLNETIFSKSNPTEELKPEAGVSYRAHYVPGIVR
jgi:hypothetical protein